MAEVTVTPLTETWNSNQPNFQMDVVGVNVSMIPTVQEELKNYLDTITQAAADFDTCEQYIGRGIKGENAVNQVKAKMTTIKNNIDEIVNDLKQFETALNNLSTNYASNDSTSTIDTQINEINV